MSTENGDINSARTRTLALEHESAIDAERQNCTRRVIMLCNVPTDRLTHVWAGLLRRRRHEVGGPGSSH